MKFNWQSNTKEKSTEETSDILNLPQAIFGMECVYTLFGEIKGAMLRASIIMVNKVICELVDDAINRQKRQPVDAALYVIEKVNGRSQILEAYIEFFCAAEYAVRQYRLGVDEDVATNEMCVLIQKIVTDSNNGEKIPMTVIMDIFGSFSDMFDRIRELDKK